MIYKITVQDVRDYYTNLKFDSRKDGIIRCALSDKYGFSGFPTLQAVGDESVAKLANSWVEGYLNNHQSEKGYALTPRTLDILSLSGIITEKEAEAEKKLQGIY